MPTYNDAETIIESINSVFAQTYQNWELIIINDGSTDNTETIIKSILQKKKVADKIKYIFQINQGQLNAIINSISYITGDYVYILHSDDVFFDENVLFKASQFLSNKNLDGIITTLIPTFSKNNTDITGKLKIKKYVSNKKTLINLALNSGANLYMDMAFIKKEKFIEDYYYNYLTWNRPFWASIEKGNVLNIKSVNFEFFRYRVYNGNYIQSDLGKLVEINGELRTLTDLLGGIYLPCYSFQRIVFKIIYKLKLHNVFTPIYFKKKTPKTKVAKIITKFINRKLKNTKCLNDEYIMALKNFYSIDNNRLIDLTGLEISKYVCYGKDVTDFIKSKNDLMTRLICEMNKGFSGVLVNYNDEDAIKDILHFLNISQYVEIKLNKYDTK